MATGRPLAHRSGKLERLRKVGLRLPPLAALACRSYRRDLSPFIDGELSAEEDAALQTRVSADPSLASAIESLRVGDWSPKKIVFDPARIGSLEIGKCADVAARGGINHAALHRAVPVDSGHDDPHQLSLSPSAAFRQVDGDDSGRRAGPAGHTPH